ncbi:MAG: ABC transporter permease [Acidimicrobiales bacterium]
MSPVETDMTAVAPLEPAAPVVDEAVRARRRMHVQELALPVVIVVLIAFGAIAGAATDRPFLTTNNLATIVTQASVVGIIAVGMTFVIATGGIDLSVGSMLAAASVAGAVLLRDDAVPDTTAIFMLATIGFAVLLGLVNGLVVAYGRVVPFIATLAMLAIGRGLALRLSDRTDIPLLELTVLRQLGQRYVPAVIFIAVAAIGWVGLNLTRYGRHVVAVGGNREAARIAGIPTAAITASVFGLSGLCVGLAAIIQSARLGTASPVSGSLLELDAIAAVVIGGTSLAGGRATITGTFLGVITFALVFNLLTLLNLPIEYQHIVRGGIILAAVLIQRREG